MNQNHRLEAHSEHIHRSIDGTQFQQRQSAKFIVGVKNVGEHLAQKCRRVGPRVKRQFLRLVPVAERPQVVDAQNVIGVRVSVEAPRPRA